MSCKVITRSVAVPTNRLFFPSTEPETAVEAAAPESSEPQADAFAAEHVAGLHTRIVDLEQALKTNVRQAREAGFREGEKAGRDRATAEFQPVLERSARAVGDLAGLRGRIRREAEGDLVGLAIAVARRILRREISVEPEAIQGLVKAALEKAQVRDLCRIRIHPDHAPLVRRHLEATGNGGCGEVTADASLQLGDVIVETKRGDLDASVETQLREIERGFADRLREGN